jgi:hypothetical protein
MRLTLLTDKKNRIVKEFIDKDLNKASTEHLMDGTGLTLDIPLSGLPNLIRSMNQHQCLSNGIVEPAGDIEYPIKSKNKASETDVQRSTEWFSWPTGPAGIYFDFDKFDGTMEEGVEILCSIDKNLEEVGMVGLYSSSGKLFDTETGLELSKKSSFHIWIEVDEGTLIQQYCDLIFDHLILKGFGSVKVVKKSGARRLQSIVDKTVWSAPNREIFEANPVCCPGLESRRLDMIEFEDGNLLNLSKSIEELTLSKEDKIKLSLTIHELKNSETVLEESRIQREAGRLERAKRRAAHTERSLKLESKRTVTDEEWEDNNGVLHCYLGANDYILDSNAKEIKVKDILNDPEEWDGRSLPDPVSPYKRGDEARGIVGQGIAYVRYNKDETVHIFSFYGDVEYHLIWDMNSILEEIAEIAKTEDQDELDGFIDTVFSETATNHRLTSTEISTVGRFIADTNKELDSGTSSYGTDARAVPAELKKTTANRDVLEAEARQELVDEHHINKLNSKFGVCLLGGHARMVEEVFNPELHEWSPEFVAVSEQKIVMKNQRVTKSIGGKLKSVGIVEDWEINPKRNSYDRVVFQPKNNIFRGCGCKPIIKQGGEYNQFMGYLANLDNAKRCKKILRHIKHIWCSNNKSIYLYTIKWLSELFQKPWEVGAPYLVLKSQQGAGKNIIIDHVLCRLLGAHAISTSNKEDLIGRFNSHLGINILLFLDEAIFAGDPRNKSLMKGLINPLRMNEKKGIDKEKGKNYTKIIMATNEEHAANIEITDRRHVYLPVSDEQKGNSKYFEELMEEIENGGREAFLKFMLEHKSDINLHVLPDGQSEQRMLDMLKSERPAIKFIRELVEYGAEQFDTEAYRFSELEFKGWGKKAILISKPKLFDMFRVYCRKSDIKVPHTDVTEFMTELSTRGVYAGSKKLRKRAKEFGASGVIPEGEVCCEYGRKRDVKFYGVNRE